MSEMVILRITSEIGEQVLNSMVDMLDCRDLDIVPIVNRLSILIGTILSDTGSGEESVCRKHMKRVWRVGLLAAVLICDNGNVGCDAENDLTRLLAFSDH